MSTIALTCVAIAILLLAVAVHRLRGVADRLVAVDALSACVLAACLLAAATTGHLVYLDVALGFAIVSFLGTVSWANALSAARGDRR